MTEEKEVETAYEAERMVVSGPGAFDLVEGVPLAEYNTAALGPCIRCGRGAKESGKGKVIEMSVSKGVLTAQTLCLDCMTPDERADYQEVEDA